MADPGDLLALLAVARTRTHLAAAASLGVNPTTVARRIRALERDVGERLLVDSPEGWELTATGREVLSVSEAIKAALDRLPGGNGNGSGSGAARVLRGVVRVSSTEVFGLRVVAPALINVQRMHPGISFELASVTRPTPAYGPAADLDIGVTRPASSRVEVQKLVDYELGLFAASGYFKRRPKPLSLSDLAKHSPIYYIESMLQVADLDIVHRLFSRGAEVLGATSVLAQLELTRGGVGIGILPVYLAANEPGLVRVLPDQASFTLTYWMSGRRENLRRPEVLAVANAIELQTRRIFAS